MEGKRALAYASIAVCHQGSQDRARSWRQELVVEARKGTAYWLAQLLPYRTHDYQPRDGSTFNALNASHINY